MTLCTWKRLLSPHTMDQEQHQIGNTKIGPICSVSLGRCSGWHSPHHKQKSLAKELVCLKHTRRESRGFAWTASKSQHEVCDIVQCLAEDDLHGTA